MSTANRYLNTKVTNTNYKCRTCGSMVMKFINSTPDELVGKYMCLCTDDKAYPVGPQFPLYEAE